MLARSFGIAGWLLVAAVALSWTGPSSGQDRGQRSEVSGVLKSVDIGAGTITVSVTVTQARGEERREPEVNDKTFSLAKNVEVVTGSGAGGSRGERPGAGLCKEIKLVDLATGVKVSLALSADQKTVEGILAEGPSLRGRLKSVDADKNSLTIQLAGSGGGRGEAPAPDEEKTYSVAPDAEFAVDDGRGSRFSLKEAKLASLPTGALVTIQLYVDLKKVQSVLAEGPSYQGTIKALDPAKGTLTLVVAVRGENPAEMSLVLSSTAVVLTDDGKGRRMSIKQGKLGDVPVGAAATVKMSSDQVNVMHLRAEGLTLTGQLKSVDATKGTIVIAVPKPGAGRGDDPEEKTLTVAKDAHISIDNNDSKLADLKADDSPTVVLRLTLDQQNVRSVTVRKASQR